MKGVKKTNAARILDGLGISYTLENYPVDPDDLSAVHVAEQIGKPAQQIFKTLVCRGDKTGILMACIPGDGELDLKAAASLSGNKRVELVHLKEVQALTGYIRGGCSPLGAKKDYPVFIDESARRWDEIAISAGVRGEQIFLTPTDLETATKGIFGKITR
ncbi:Cys-tRNA(Pro) deacylase [Selenomonas sp. TAMA-11512]|uniref:Cys-tRNA(Pro) deacylase n=1 Tax=Selenomonas sp. TAMA-11512 TaxID=3095337 RepID=UPI003091A27D|nr:Cys-tRNA(Pro) deacylase [Selenomonas sp. TAMA-11512]